MAFAGIWESFGRPDGSVMRTFAIITTAAGPDVVELHDRMPVILEAADWRPGLVRWRAIPPRCCTRRRKGRCGCGRWLGALATAEQWAGADDG